MPAGDMSYVGQQREFDRPAVTSDAAGCDSGMPSSGLRDDNFPETDGRPEVLLEQVQVAVPDGSRQQVAEGVGEIVKDTAGGGRFWLLDLAQAKAMVAQAESLPDQVRKELAKGIWTTTDYGWYVICLGRNHMVFRQGIGLVLWLNGVPFTLNPRLVRPASPTPEPDTLATTDPKTGASELCLDTETGMSVESHQADVGSSDDCSPLADC